MAPRSACLGYRPHRATDSFSLVVTCQDFCSEEQAPLPCEEVGEPAGEISRRGSLHVTSLSCGACLSVHTYNVSPWVPSTEDSSFFPSICRLWEATGCFHSLPDVPKLLATQTEE